MKTNSVIVVLLTNLVYACASKPANVQTVSKEEAKPKVIILKPELAEGKNLYENKCANCHRLYEAKEFSKEQWKPIMTRMQKKARIDDAQTASIYNYITSDL